MLISKYVASRKDVCAGQLLKTVGMSFKIYDENNNEISQEQMTKQGVNLYNTCKLSY